MSRKYQPPEMLLLFSNVPVNEKYCYWYHGIHVHVHGQTKSGPEYGKWAWGHGEGNVPPACLVAPWHRSEAVS